MKPSSSLWSQFTALGKRERYTIAIILLAAFIMGVWSVISLKRQTVSPATIPPTQYNPDAALPAQANTTQATVSLTTENASIKAGDTVAVTLSIDSGNLPVDAADFVLKVDPLVLSPLAVEPGTFFQQYPRQEMAADGTVTVSAVANLENNTIVVPKGKGEVATIRFQALRSAKTAFISFDREKTIIASGGENIAGEFTDLLMTISDTNR